MNAPLAALFASGHAADIVLAVMAIEAIVLIWLLRVPPAAAIVPALPGALIVLALRAALTGADWTMIALPLALSWPAHLIDLRQRIRPNRPRAAL